jgi:oligoribonuclease NrnB/cAMP/cGMP phosphodiesterase (DHH superfamily)
MKLNMIIKPLVVYHGPTCADGLAAAWCFWNRYKDNVEYKVGLYQADVDYGIFKNRNVYLVDFLYPPETIYEICKVANHVVVLDHHEDAIKKIFDFYAESNWPENLDMTGCDTRYSGAMLAWLYLNTRTPPAFLHYIQDRDLWSWQIPESKNFSRGLFSEPLDFYTLDRCYNEPSFVEHLITKGQILNDEAHIRIERTIKYSTRYIQAGDLTIPVTNCPVDFVSELGNLLAYTYPLAIMYFDMANSRDFSLRSASNNPSHVAVDVVARLFGGNGHKHAAGFKRSLDEPLSQTLDRIVSHFQP